MTMFRKLNFWTLPPWPKGAGTQKSVPVHVPFMEVTGWISEKIFLTPQPPWYAQVPPLGMTKMAERKSRLIHKRHTKLGLKIFEIDYVIQI